MLKELIQAFKQPEEQRIAVGLLAWEAEYFLRSTSQHIGQVGNARYSIHPHSSLKHSLILEKTLLGSGEESLRLIRITTSLFSPFPIAKAYQLESLDMANIDFKREGCLLTAEETRSITQALQQIRYGNLFIQEF